MCPCDNFFEEGIRAWPRRQNPARGGVSGGNGWKAQKAPRLLAENHALRHLAEWDAGGRRHQHWGRRRCEIWLCHGAAERYTAGKASYYEVLEAQQQLFPAELNLARTQRDQLLAVVTLYKGLGGGWQDEMNPNSHP